MRTTTQPIPRRTITAMMIAGSLACALLQAQPSGPTLAFASDRSGRYQIHTLSPSDPASLFQVTTAGSGNQESRGPDWSTAGVLAYQFGASGVRGIHSIHSDGSNDQRLTFDTSDERDPSWSPDHQFIVYAKLVKVGTSSAYDIYVHPMAGGSDYALVESPRGQLRPAWSPDGAWIAYTSDENGDSEIMLVPVQKLDGRIVAGQPRALTDNSDNDNNPCWSPDSRHIAFQGTRFGNMDIHRMPAAPGANQTRLTTHAANDSNPTWSPDGNVIAFVSDRDGNREIYLMSASGGEADFTNVQRITDHAGQDDDPAWLPAVNLMVKTIAWNITHGGIDFEYEIVNGVINNATTAKLFWAAGTTADDILAGAVEIFTLDVPAGISGTSPVINVPPSLLASQPADATHLLFVLDFDNLVPEATEADNIASLRLQETLDAITYQQDGLLPTDPASYLAPGPLREGAVADGYSRLLLCFHLGDLAVSAPGVNLHFILPGGLAQGRLRPLTSDNWSTDVPAYVLPRAGDNLAFCLYESPRDLPAVLTGSTVELFDGGAMITSRTIELRRPPVVLVHGIWSSFSETWEASGARSFLEDRIGPDKRGFSILPADYRLTNAEEFDINAPFVFGFIEDAIQRCRAAGYACSQADVVAHSMGALLSRLALQRFGRQPYNYDHGNVHKLISVGTPHQGSFLADRLMLARRDTPRRYGLLALLMANQQRFLDRGAATGMSGYREYQGERISDIPGIAQVAVPAHAIVSNCAPPVGLHGDLLQLYTVLAYLVPRYADCLCETSDAVVGMASQAGGLSGGAATRWPSTAQHTAETSSGTIQTNIFRLLEAPITPSGWFDADGFTFFAGIDMPSPSALHDPPDDTVGTWLVLSGVSDNQVVVPNSTLSLSAAASDQRPLHRFALIGGTNVMELTQEPFICDFVVPASAAGALRLVALAIDSGGEPSAQFITLQVQPGASLEGISVEPQALEMRASKCCQLRVLGQFSDGVVRDITRGSAGTVYASGDETVVGVDTNGMVCALQNTSLGVGITVRNGVIWTNLQVTVDLMNVPPTAVISSDLQDISGRAPLRVQFDASLSSDPESLSLRYHWDFGDGSQSDQQRPPPQVYNSPGHYIVSLVVSDSQGLNGRSALVVTVLPAVQLAIQRTDPYPVVTLFGESGSSHVLEGSTDLRNWLPLVTNAPAGGAFAYPDTNAAAIARRFYRGLKP